MALSIDIQPICTPKNDKYGVYEGENSLLEQDYVIEISGDPALLDVMIEVPNKYKGVQFGGIVVKKEKGEEPIFYTELKPLREKRSRVSALFSAAQEELAQLRISVYYLVLQECKEGGEKNRLDFYNLFIK